MHYKSIPSSFHYKLILITLIFPFIDGNLFSQNQGISVFNLPKEATGTNMNAQEQNYSFIHNTPFSLTDSILIYNNYSHSDSAKYNKTIFQYNSSNNVINISYQNPDSDGSKWTENKRYEYTFDQNNRQTQFLQQERNSETNIWEDITKREFIYYNNGNEPISVADYHFNYYSKNWVGNWMYKYQYNNGNIVLQETYTWSKESNDWIVTTKEERTFNANQQIVSKISYYKEQVQNVWIGNQKISFSYNQVYQLEEEKSQFWDPIAGKWINSKKKLFYYNNIGKQAGWETYRWDRDRNQWNNWWKVDNEYDNYGNLNYLSNYKWNHVHQRWIDGWQITNHFDPENNQQEEIGLIWNPEKESWEGIYKLFHQYNAEYSVKTISDFAWDNTQEQWVLSQKRFHYLSVPELIPFTLNIVNKSGQPINIATVSINGDIFEQGNYYFPALIQETLSINISALGYKTKSFNHPLNAYNSMHTIILEEITQSIDEQLVNGLYIYPIPTYNNIYIKSNGDCFIQRVILYSSNGMMVRLVNANSQTSRISVSDLPSGLYLLHVETNSGLKIEKIIVGHR